MAAAVKQTVNRRRVFRACVSRYSDTRKRRRESDKERKKEREGSCSRLVGAGVRAGREIDG